jgi:uncharacterized protein
MARAQVYTVESVPNTKLQNNSYVSNPNSILSQPTVNEINSILGSLEQQTTSQVAVVAIQSIGDEDIFDFAQKLFKLWGIGQAKEDNGLLILLVMEKRTIRLHTGYGLEGDLPDIVCKHIEIQKMVPHFKEQDFDGGLLDGVREVARILGNTQYADSLRYQLISSETESYDTKNENSDVPLDISEFLIWSAGIWSVIVAILFFYNRAKGLFTDSSMFQPTHTPNIKTGSIHFLFWFLIIPVGIMVASIFINQIWVFMGAFYGYMALGALETRIRLNLVYNDWIQKKEYHGLHQLYQQKLSFWYMVAVVIPLPFAFLIGPYKRKIQFLRDHPRDCGQCGKPCTKLSEQTEDPFLNRQQQFEETLKSVDYDVWRCNSCSAVQVFRYPSTNTHYEDCPKCATVAYYVASTRTLRAATTSREGLKEEVKNCKYCKFRNVRTFSIPKLSDSSSSSSGGSSGGSWGGGSSGGGGASSSW